jgi:cystathionine beta-synthase
MFRFSRKRKLEPIGLDTKLYDLSKFFEKNSVAFVTETTADGSHVVTHVVTKIDLISFLVKNQ